MDPALVDRTITHLAGIHDASLPVRSMTIPGIDGALEARILSTDLKGSSTRLVRLRAGWGPRARGAFDAEVELFVIQGSVEAGPHTLEAGDYVHLPMGRNVPPLQVAADGAALLMTSAPVRYDPTFAGPPAELAPGRAAETEWIPVPEMPGRHIKPLGRGPVGDVWLSGARGWNHGDHSPHQHRYHEECFVIEGEIVMQEADKMVTAGPGTYFFRPAGIPHCGPGSHCEETMLAFHRAFGTMTTQWADSSEPGQGNELGQDGVHCG